MVSEENKIYQWGNLFKQSTTEKTDMDMLPVKESLFNDKEIIMFSGKFKVCGALVKDNQVPSA